MFGVRCSDHLNTCSGIWYLVSDTWYQVPEHLFRKPEHLFRVSEHLFVFGEHCSGSALQVPSVQSVRLRVRSLPPICATVGLGHGLHAIGPTGSVKTNKAILILECKPDKISDQTVG